MKIIDRQISISELKDMTVRMYGDFIKVVVDIEKEIMAVDAEMHADEEKMLLDNGSRQENLWGINLYPELRGEDFIEFDSMINLRPAQGNRSRGVEDENTRNKIKAIINKLIKDGIPA